MSLESTFRRQESGLASLLRRSRRQAKRRLAYHRPFRAHFESLEARNLLAAQVVTDQPDYPPGSVALITAFNNEDEGLNFSAGETVKFQVTRTDGIEDFPDGNLPWQVTDGEGGFDPYVDESTGVRVFPDLSEEAGVVQTTWNVEEQYAGAFLLVTATGLDSDAEATHEFTDAVSLTATYSQTPVPTLTATAAGLNKNKIYSVEYVQPDLTVAATHGTFSGTVANWGLIDTFSPTAPFPTGTWTLNLYEVNAGDQTKTLTASAQVSVTVAKLDQTITFGAIADRTYGDASFVITASATSGLPVTFTAGGDASVALVGSAWTVTIIGAGSATITAHQAGNTTYNAAPDVARTFNIDKATTTTVVDCGLADETYNGFAHEPCIAYWYSNEADEEGGMLPVSYSNNTNAGSATASASFGGNDNHYGSDDSSGFEIDPAEALVTIVNYSDVYDAGEHTASVTITGVSGVELAYEELTGTDVLDSGSVSASTSDPNYAPASGTAALEITPAEATVVESPYSGVYDANPHTASVTITGVGGVELAYEELTGTDVLDSGLVSASTSDPNYEPVSGTAALEITPAEATVVESPYSGVYDANPHTASVTITGVGGVELAYEELTGTDVLDSGSVSASTSDPNYEPVSGTAALEITPAEATVVESPYSGVYDANPHTASVTITGVSGVELAYEELTGTDVLDSGSVSASTSDPNYEPASGTAALEITPAEATVVESPYSGVYDANPHTASVTITGVGGVELAYEELTGTDVLDSGSVSASTSDPNYEPASGTAALEITPAALTVTADFDPVDADVDTFVKIHDGLSYPNTPLSFTVRYAGFVPGEDNSDLGGTLTFSGLGTTATGIGTYSGSVLPGGLTSGNYAIQFLPGTVVIVPNIQPTTVTSSSLKEFDTHGAPGKQFNLIYVQDSGSTFRLNSSNPGQFYDNVFFERTAGPVVLKIPSPFVTQGANPIHVYSGMNTLVTGNEGAGTLAFVPGTDISSLFTKVVVPGPGGYGLTVTLTPNVALASLPLYIYANVHLDYGYKGTGGWKRADLDGDGTANDATLNTTKIRGISTTSVVASAPATPSGQIYTFGLDGTNDDGADEVYSVNIFKKSVGVAGTVTKELSAPVTGMTVKLYKGTKLITQAQTDSDGAYFLDYKHTGSSTTYTVKLYKKLSGTELTSAPVTLKANGFQVVNFLGVNGAAAEGENGSATGDAANFELLTFEVDTISSWNIYNALDTDNDDFVSPGDALSIINYLNAGYDELTSATLDATDDGFITLDDAMTIINYLNSQSDDAVDAVFSDLGSETDLSDSDEHLLMLLASPGSTKRR